LPAHAAGRLALLQEPSLIDHKDRVVIGQRFERIITHDIAQIVGIPPAPSQDGLLPPWAGIARRFGSHPTRLATLIAQQAVKKKPG
jgi:hypothetical protein